MGNQVYVDAIDSIVWHPEAAYPRTSEHIALKQQEIRFCHYAPPTPFVWSVSSHL